MVLCAPSAKQVFNPEKCGALHRSECMASVVSGETSVVAYMGLLYCTNHSAWHCSEMAVHNLYSSITEAKTERRKQSSICDGKLVSKNKGTTENRDPLMHKRENLLSSGILPVAES